MIRRDETQIAVAHGYDQRQMVQREGRRAGISAAFSVTTEKSGRQKPAEAPARNRERWRLDRGVKYLLELHYGAAGSLKRALTRRRGKLYSETVFISRAGQQFVRR